MARPFDLPLHINYYPSRWIIALIITAHIGAAFCLAPTVIPLWIKFLLFLAICLSVGGYYRRYRALCGNPLHLILNRENEWSAGYGGEIHEPVCLRPGSLVHPLLVIMRFKREGGARDYTVILTGECCDKALLRRLRVRLRYPKAVRR